MPLMTTVAMPHALALALCNRAVFVFCSTRMGYGNIVAWSAQWALSLAIGLSLIVGLAVMYEAMLRLLFVYAPLMVTAIAETRPHKISPGTSCWCLLNVLASLAQRLVRVDVNLSVISTRIADCRCADCRSTD